MDEETTEVRTPGSETLTYKEFSGPAEQLLIKAKNYKNDAFAMAGITLATVTGGLVTTQAPEGPFKYIAIGLNSAGVLFGGSSAISEARSYFRTRELIEKLDVTEKTAVDIQQQVIKSLSINSYDGAERVRVELHDSRSFDEIEGELKLATQAQDNEKIVGLREERAKLIGCANGIGLFEGSSEEQEEKEREFYFRGKLGLDTSGVEEAVRWFGRGGEVAVTHVGQDPKMEGMVAEYRDLRRKEWEWAWAVANGEEQRAGRLAYDFKALGWMGDPRKELVDEVGDLMKLRTGPSA
ncbi:hypothetical protein A2962_02865 [Candidatus Woesebacteria bacterium RIFCSPLOWO2_01_FULL_39_61]|uniref:Uncharacterized protein n=1 Tax=Candidatus Woesebacteria bacterium RIFCSPHIGHO2_02_FULL_39_13 TaxID=1802505 RepID=A0A1F7YYL7_9BACT|nr:MAG: hypothetical protein A2692_00050 [Candidatus Woesebacteria bacterium RIFCSPHIGHO2_01_FULL_39_95]OGM32422.1 MAG: hypothetical protein A3D01_04580 [Candidatus Woesebacteria bacterium RIFCSPHIGHO2_02_FULL_39_13]OGM38130.1 MAG: hypothetical protein A3E13_02610 [Candidatus Woesebacteria bacterium RIFCSPHIGHO2_12_FULL_40_20]OGM67381.1 MAG: hypothetical protein A2962_02865 [Candidatus Woesebacteria bacterium RIFCSPLOWO2_01_FULL_39_61]